MRDPARDVEQEQSLQRERERLAAEQRIEQGDPPWEHASGVQSVVAAVRDLRFPLSKEDIEEQVGDRRVHVAEHAEFALADILPKLKEDTFTSPGDFQTAVQRHWEGIRFMTVPEEQRPAEGGRQPQHRGR